VPLHPRRPDPLLQKARVVHDQDGVPVTEVVDHVLTHIGEHLIGIAAIASSRGMSWVTS
jgi:hypothetical protein